MWTGVVVTDITNGRASLSMTQEAIRSRNSTCSRLYSRGDTGVVKWQLHALQAGEGQKTCFTAMFALAYYTRFSPLSLTLRRYRTLPGPWTLSASTPLPLVRLYSHLKAYFVLSYFDQSQ